MSGRHVEDVLPPSPTQKLGEDCALLDDWLATGGYPAHACQHDATAWRCCHGGHGRRVLDVDYAPALDAAAATAIAAFREQLDEHTAPRDGAPLSFVLLDETSDWDRMRARSSSSAGLASLRDPWANDPDRTTRREAWS